MKRLFLISGRSMSGKDAAAKIITEQLNQNKILIIHFGDLVKYFAKEFYNWDGNKDEQGRALLQNLGTDTMRAHFPTYWAEVVAKFISATQDNWDYVVIPDWRFCNEYDTIFKYFKDILTTIHVKRLNEDGSEFINPNMTEAQLNHQSENDLKNNSFTYDYIIYNIGGLEHMFDSISVILDEIQKL